MSSDPSPEHLTPEQLPCRYGRFELIELLGVGGMGRVFRAVMTGPSGFRKEIALKVLRPRPGGAAPALDSEARIGALLRHPNLVDTYDFGLVAGRPYLAMELVRGLDLASLAERVRLEPAQVVQVGAALAAGLQRAHELHLDGAPAGLVHRDLKPSNVVVSHDGIVKILDFGLATLRSELHSAEDDAAWGTPAYMSPEQAGARALDHRSDLWALGVILFELAVGEPLLRGESLIELMMSLQRVPERLAEPGGLGAVDAAVSGLAPIVARCLELDPAQRWSDAAEVERALEQLGPTLPPAPTLRSLVRDLLAGGSGEHLLPEERPTLGPVRAPPGTVSRGSPLPRPTHPLLGRRTELDALAAALDRAGLVTLLGPGGMGKTRLAIEHALRDSAPPERRAWFVPAQEARTLEGFLRVVGEALAVPWGRGDASAQLERLGQALAGVPAGLVVLDNLEQVLEPAARCLGRWLELAPGVRFVATSRERLGLRDEAVVEVGPLALDDAVELFVARAQEARPGFQADADARATVAVIARRLDRLPLALELAAARAALLPVEQIASRLDQRFRLLRSRDRGADPRQATLEGTIAWSWALLAEAEQATLSACALFRGGFFVEQAEGVVDLRGLPGDPWVLDTVQALRDKSLLWQRDTSEGVPRFHLYESVRVYATRRFEERPDGEATRRRFDEVFAALAESLRADLRTGRALDASRRFDLEEGNLTAVLEGSGSAEHRVRAGLALTRHLSRRGPHSKLHDVIRVAWELRERVGPALQAELMALWAQTIRMGVVASDGVDWTRRAIETAREAGEPALGATLCVHLAYDLTGAEGALEAVEELRAARELLQQQGTRAQEAHVVSALASALAYAGRRAEGLRLRREGLEMHRASGNQRMVGVDAVAIGSYLALDGELEQARRWFERGRASFQAAEDAMSLEVSLGNLAHLELELGDFDAARAAIDQSTVIRRRLGMGTSVSLVPDRAVLRLLDGDVEGALRLLAPGAAPPGKRSEYTRATWAAFRGIGRALHGDPDAGLVDLDEAAAIFGRRRLGQYHALCLANAAGVAALAGQRARALSLLEQAQTVAGESGGPWAPLLIEVAEAQVQLARARELRDADLEEQALVEAERLLDSLESGRAGVHLALGLRLLRAAL